MIHDLENPTLASPLKVEEPELATIKQPPEDLKFAVKPPETQRPQQGNQFPSLEK